MKPYLYSWHLLFLDCFSINYQSTWPLWYFLDIMQFFSWHSMHKYSLNTCQLSPTGPVRPFQSFSIPIKCNLFNSHMVIWAEESSRFASTYCKLFNILLNECQTEHSNMCAAFSYSTESMTRNKGADQQRVRFCHVSAVHGYRVTL